MDLGEGHQRIFDFISSSHFHRYRSRNFYKNSLDLQNSDCNAYYHLRNHAPIE